MKKVTLFNAPLLTVFILVAALNFTSCHSGKTENDGVADGDKTANVQKDTVVKTIFYSVPSPIETATLIQKVGLPYNKEYLNNYKRASSYTTTGAKALNLGVYGADLSFTSIYEQNQESMLYLKSANTLAKDLGISGAFDENTANRLEANKSNKDSLLGIISESFWNADAYLKENERPGTSSLIIAGGWIESIYIATRIQRASNNGDITNRIAEQKYTLGNLTKMLKRHTDDPVVADISKDLEDLKTVYDQIADTKKATTTSKDANGVTTIGGGADQILLTDDQLATIIKKVDALRTKITK